MSVIQKVAEQLLGFFQFLEMFRKISVYICKSYYILYVP